VMLRLPVDRILPAYPASINVNWGSLVRRADVGTSTRADTFHTAMGPIGQSYVIQRRQCPPVMATSI
jgi:hypothetical protein